MRKKFWFPVVLIGIAILVISVVCFWEICKNQAEKKILKIVNYMKV